MVFDWNISDFEHAQSNKEPISVVRADARYTTGTATKKVVDSVDALVTFTSAGTLSEDQPGISSSVSRYEVKPLIPIQNVKKKDTIVREQTGETLTVTDERTVGRRQTIFCESLEKEN